MSNILFFAHPPYAEDQPLARTILTTHVLTRFFQVGALGGLLSGSAYHSLLLLRQRRSPSPILPSPRIAFLPPTILRFTAAGAALGTVFAAIGLPARMWGKEEIEWQDRAWRLLENKGQVETDTWGYVGLGVGAVACWGGSRGMARGVRARVVVGGAGVGTTVGWLGYMVWRYAVKGGRFES
ncbi:hypothetical protein MMC13_004483 [Lambiella insularis]|nr:hypothetical protein [Lambiella insularis]